MKYEGGSVISTRLGAVWGGFLTSNFLLLTSYEEDLWHLIHGCNEI